MDSTRTAMRLFLLGILFPVFCQAQIVTTVAGSGSTLLGSFGGDGGPATAALLNDPVGVTTDIAGNIYIGDAYNNRIRKINTSGTISTIAGTGLAGYTGDGAAATDARLNHPGGIATDLAGNVYFADNQNNVIRKINLGGIISTVAGNGFGAGSGVGGYTGDGGPATAAELSMPVGVGLDSAGNIYFSDYGNNCIRKVNTSGTITTIAGTGTAGFSGDGGPATAAKLNKPLYIAVDKSGNVYIPDQTNRRFRKVDITGTITTITGNGTSAFTGDGGPATAAQVYGPESVALDAMGNIYLGDQIKIRKISAATGFISTIAGNSTGGFGGDGGPATAAAFSVIDQIHVDGEGNVYVSDFSNQRIRMVGYPTLRLNPPAVINSELTIYPNPSLTGLVTVSVISNVRQQVQLTISNALGEEVISKQLITNEPAELKMELPGVYSFVARTGQQVLSKKVVVMPR